MSPLVCTPYPRCVEWEGMGSTLDMELTSRQTGGGGCATWPTSSANVVSKSTRDSVDSTNGISACARSVWGEASVHRDGAMGACPLPHLLVHPLRKFPRVPLRDGDALPPRAGLDHVVRLAEVAPLVPLHAGPDACPPPVRRHLAPHALHHVPRSPSVFRMRAPSLERGVRPLRRRVHVPQVVRCGCRRTRELRGVVRVALHPLPLSRCTTLALLTSKEACRRSPHPSPNTRA